MAADLVTTNSLCADEGCGRRERRRWGFGGGRDHGSQDGARGGRETGHGCRDDARGRHGHGHAGHGTCGAGHGAACGERRLCEAGAGDTVTVTGILGDESFRGRIMALGILPGVTLRVVGGGRRQPLLVALPGSRCVVDQRSSEMIAVRGARPVAEHERTRP